MFLAKQGRNRNQVLNNLDTKYVLLKVSLEDNNPSVLLCHGQSTLGRTFLNPSEQCQGCRNGHILEQICIFAARTNQFLHIPLANLVLPILFCKGRPATSLLKQVLAKHWFSFFLPLLVHPSTLYLGNLESFS